MSIVAAILGLGTAVPTLRSLQEAYVQFARNMNLFSPEYIARIATISKRTAIACRHTVVPDFINAPDEWIFFDRNDHDNIPRSGVRNAWYKLHAPPLAFAAARRALEDWGGDAQTITHVVVVSCTGVLAPGIEFLLIDELGLARNVQRYGLNFMGCFGAIRGLALAKALAGADQKNRVLLVCVELCTLHWQADELPDTMIANLLFSDGAAAAIVGIPAQGECSIWNIEHEYAYALPHSRDRMTWEMGDHGFIMRLALDVAPLLAQELPTFVRALTQRNAPVTEYAWAIHPGGRAIVEHIERVLNLSRESTQASWDILAQYGNMSSSTLLFIIEHMRTRVHTGQETIALAFGPGLSLEGLMLTRKERI